MDIKDEQTPHGTTLRRAPCVRAQSPLHRRAACSSADRSLIDLPAGWFYGRQPSFSQHAGMNRPRGRIAVVVSSVRCFQVLDIALSIILDSIVAVSERGRRRRPDALSDPPYCAVCCPLRTFAGRETPPLSEQAKSAAAGVRHSNKGRRHRRTRHAQVGMEAQLASAGRGMAVTSSDPSVSAARLTFTPSRTVDGRGAEAQAATD